MSSLPPTLGLRHIALFIESGKFEATKSFYADGMGMRVDWEPDPDNIYLTSGHDNVALHRAEGPVQHAGGALDHLGILVPSADDVRRWHRRLESMVGELGFEIVAPVKLHRDGATSFYLRDPGGNKLQIIHIPSVSDA